MRNYLFTRGMQWRAFIFDDTHSPQGDFPVYAIGRNDVDLASQITIQNNLIINGLPPDWTAEFTYNDAMTIYFVLDKDALMVTIQAFAATFVADAVANQPPFYPMLVNPKQTPRKTGWTDPAGIKRAPTPSDTGKTIDISGETDLEAFISGLPAYAQLLKSEGRVRDAGIVLFIYQEVLDGKISIAEALAQLRKQRL